MKTTFAAVALLPLLSAVSAAQTAEGAATQERAATPATVLHVKSRLITVDAVIHNSDGDPVHHLDKAQFHIFEDGVEQKITHFEEHAADAPVTATVPFKLPPHVYSNYPMVQGDDSVTILLLDRLNTPLQQQAYAQKQMIAYLRQIKGSDKLAIFVLGSELRLLQGFSTNPAILLAALNNKKGEPGTPANGAQAASDVDDPSFAVAEAGVANELDTLEQDQEAFRSDLRLQETLEAFQEVAAYVAGFSGRKSVIWFSGSFPVSLEPNEVNSANALSNGTAITPNLYARQVTRTIDMLSAEQVAIYPVDVGGLRVSGAYSATQSRGGRSLGPSLANEFQRDAGKHSSMEDLAESTGGFATFNNNDLKGALARIMNDNGNYYSLAYVPSNRNEDGGFRRIRLEVDGKKLNVAYRRGYYSDNPNQADALPVDADAAPGQDPMLLQLASMMQRGAPDTTQILFKVQVAPAPAATQPGPAAKPTVEEKIDWAIDLHAVTFQPAEDGHHHAALLLSAIAYDVGGKPLQSSRERLELDMDDDQYVHALRFGLQLHRVLQVPPGDLFLHVGVLDESSQRKGSTEIPMRVSAAETPAPKLGPGIR